MTNKKCVPSVRNWDQIFVVQSLAGYMATELRVMLLRIHVARVEKNCQAEWLQRVEMLSP